MHRWRSFRVGAYTDLLVKLVNEHSPSIVLATASTRGRELLAAASADLDAALLDDVIELSLEDGKLHATSPVLCWQSHDQTGC